MLSSSFLTLGSLRTEGRDEMGEPWTPMQTLPPSAAANEVLKPSAKAFLQQLSASQRWGAAQWTTPAWEALRHSQSQHPAQGELPNNVRVHQRWMISRAHWGRTIYHAQPNPRWFSVSGNPTGSQGWLRENSLNHIYFCIHTYIFSYFYV